MSKTIEDILKDMPLDQKAKDRLKESWDAALADAKIAQEAVLFETNAKQYDADLAKIHESFGTFLEERIKPHVEELQEGVAEVEQMKVNLSEKTTNVKNNARAYIKKRLGAVEQIIEARVHTELSELHEDVVANRRATLQTINESRNTAAMNEHKFKVKAAKVLENIINVKVPAQLDPLREDIMASRQDNFGREIFEAFQTVFRRQHHNTSAEFAKIVNENTAMSATMRAVKVKAAKAVKESRETATAATRAYGKLNESVIRQQTMARLLKPLKGNARVQMKTLLEATNVKKMDETFRKSLPQITRAATPAKVAVKPVLRESAKPTKSMEFRSGGTADLTESDYDEFDSEVSDIRRLAGNR